MHLKLTPAKDFVAPAPEAAPEQAKSGGIKSLFGFGKKAAKAEDAPSSYSTGATKIGALLADPAAKAILDKYFPGVSSDSRISMAKAMTLRTVQKFAPELFTAEALDAVDAELCETARALSAPSHQPTPAS